MSSEPLYAEDGTLSNTRRNTETGDLYTPLSDNVTRKVTGNNNVLNAVSSGKSNILNKYRSYTYNFTLAAVDKTHANDPKIWRKSVKDFIILRSGGKGNDTITEDVVGQDTFRNETEIKVRDQGSEYYDPKDTVTINKKVFNGTDTTRNRALVKAFNNSDSAAKFDFFIDNIEIETTMAPQKSGGFTLPTKIEFDVFEPYSIEGFIEALQVSAEAAGYENYVVASFLLLVDFIGYPDNQVLPSPTRINGSSRYFLIKFTGLGIEITEKGTKYHCTAVPFNEIGFGEAGKIKKPLTMEGTKVKELLESLMTSVNQRQNGDEDISEDSESDTYEIKFPIFKNGQWDYSDYDTTIADQDMSNSHLGGALVGLVDPKAVSTATSLSSLLQSKESNNKIQFPENVNIHDIISATIRDSMYVRKLITTIGTGADNPDKFGMVRYFLVRLEVTNKARTDPYKKRPYQTFRYVVTPHRVHYTFIPEYARSEKISKQLLQTLVHREYDYIYTGLNTDILNFKLDYNFLYFEAVPTALGRNRDSGAEDRAIAVPLEKQDQPAGSKKVVSNGELVGTPANSAERTKVQPGGELNTGQPTPDPYAAMAKNMHLALQNSVSRVTGDLEIIGDPFFLVTGGIGNYNPPSIPNQPGVTTDGEADNYYGQILVQVNFRNPIDINSLGQGGLMRFRPGISSTSGIFMVSQCKNSFRDGTFKQVLSLIRIPGELTDKNNVTNPAQGNPTESRLPSQSSPSA